MVIGVAVEVAVVAAGEVLALVVAAEEDPEAAVVAGEDQEAVDAVEGEHPGVAAEDGEAWEGENRLWLSLTDTAESSLPEARRTLLSH